MKRLLMILALPLVVSLSTPILAVPLAYDGYFSIDTVVAEPGDHVGVSIRLNNNQVDFSALMIPVRYGSPYLTLDSVSFGGSLLPNDFNGIHFDYADLQLVKVSYLPPTFGTYPLPTISETGGKVAELFFTVSDQATAGFIPIDSAVVDTPIIVGGDTVTHIWVGAVLSGPVDDSVYFPNCIPGGIDVRIPTGIDDADDPGSLPTEYSLTQNYPNPFNPATRIEYAVPKAGHIRLEVFNVLGQLVSTPLDGPSPAGVHQLEFDGSALPSGIYFYRLTHDEGTMTRKMVLVK